MKFMLVEDGGKFKAGNIVRLDLLEQKCGRTHEPDEPVI